MKKNIKYVEFFITDIKDYCTSNRVLDLKDSDDLFDGQQAVEVKTLKGVLIFVGLNMKTWKTLYCSCTNIKTTHNTVVANIFKRAIQKSDIVYMEVEKDGDLDKANLQN